MANATEINRYHGHGVSFAFPESWELHEQLDEQSEQLTLTVQSPGTTFWSITLCFQPIDPKAIVEQVVDAFRDEYEELDVYSRNDVPGTEKREIEFVCMELINTAVARAYATPRHTVLEFSQGTDHELTSTGDVLAAIGASLEFDGLEIG